MMTTELLKKNNPVRLASEYGFGVNTLRLLENYHDTSRPYHNMWHVAEMLEFVNKYKPDLSTDEMVCLKTAIVFHDVIYDVIDEEGKPVKDNEERSAQAFMDAVNNDISNKAAHEFWMKNGNAEKVVELIMETKSHDYSLDKPLVNRAIILADLNRFCERDWNKMWAYSMMLFKEYSYVDFADFKHGRVAFLEQYAEKMRDVLPAIAYDNILRIKDTMQVWFPTIAVYPGSFNPFHVGHLNILQKAEAIFDKVIIAVGNNSKKDYSQRAALPSSIIKHYQVDRYDGYLADYVNSKNYPLTVVRGLRNSTDLQAEINQHRWIQSMNKDIRMISILCDAEFEHVSSSAIRDFESYGKQSKYKVQEI